MRLSGATVLAAYPHAIKLAHRDPCSAGFSAGSRPSPAHRSLPWPPGMCTKLSHGLQGPSMHVTTVTRSSPSPSSNPRFLTSCNRFARRSVSGCSVFATTASSNGTHALSCPVLSTKWFARLFCPLTDPCQPTRQGPAHPPACPPYAHTHPPYSHIRALCCASISGCRSGAIDCCDQFAAMTSPNGGERLLRVHAQKGVARPRVYA